MAYLKNILLYIFLIPIIGSCLLLITPSTHSKLLKSISLAFTCISFLFSLVLWFLFDKSLGSFQFCTSEVWFLEHSLVFSLGIDGISLFFVILTTMLISVCLLISWNTVNHHLKVYLALFLVMESMLIGVFSISLSIIIRGFIKYPVKIDPIMQAT